MPLPVIVSDIADFFKIRDTTLVSPCSQLQNFIFRIFFFKIFIMNSSLRLLAEILSLSTPTLQTVQFSDIFHTVNPFFKKS